MSPYDLFVIGGGSGGVRAARMAANLGARVALCEASDMGGTCVNLGCVPKKLFAYSSAYAAHFTDSERYGWSRPGASFNWNQLVANKDVEIARLNTIYQRLLERSGVHVIHGRGTLESPHSVRVGSETYDAKRILIATGSRPFLPDIPGIEHAVTSDQLFHLKSLPDRIAIVGGGYIGVEFASIFRGLGVSVDILHRGAKLLKSFDEDCVAHLTEELIKRGIRVRLQTPVQGITAGPNGMVISGPEMSLESDLVLFATGRVPNTKALGLEKIGVNTSSRGAIVVNDSYQSNIPSIYAVGDVIDRVQLTPAALEEGMRLVQYLYGDGPSPGVSFHGAPTAIFSKPEFATVGLTESEAEEAYDIEVYTSNFRAMKHTISGRDERTFMKLIVDKASDRVVGCHMVGESASEIIQGVGIALRARATKSQFDQTLGIHPTAAEEFVTMRTPRKE